MHDDDEAAPESAPDAPVRRPIPYRTEPSPDGTYRIYKERPASIPDAEYTIEDICDGSGPGSATDSELLEELLRAHGHDIPTHYLIDKWICTGENSKSIAEVGRLLDMLANPLFKIEDSLTYRAWKSMKQLDKDLQSLTTCPDASTNTSSTLPMSSSNDPSISALTTPKLHARGWRVGSVSIPILCEGAKIPEAQAPRYEVKGILYRPILDVLREAFDSPASANFNFKPFKKMWRPAPDQPPIRVYDEYYTADAWLEAQDYIDSLPLDLDDNIERCVIPLIIYFDGTLLTSFGDASAYPGYLMIACESKYSRGKPTSGGCRHFLYIPKVSNGSYNVSESKHIYW